MSLAPQTSDIRIRVLGLLIGLGVIAALWRNARALGHATPLIGLTVLGFNASVIVHGDSIRGYGLGMLTGLLAFGLVWQAADAPTPVRTVAALLSSLIAVHCLYYNAIFVLAACAGGVAVTLKRRAWRAAGLISGICGLSVVSLAVYSDVFVRARAWNAILHVDLDHILICKKIEEAFGSTGGMVHWLWVGLAVLAVGSALRAASAPLSISERERDAALFCGVALLTGASAYFVFLKALSYLTQPWYYVLLMALVAACLDAPLAVLARTRASRIVRLAAVVFVVALAIRPVWASVRTRKTNVDLIASKVGTLAVKGDLIVVNPWYLGITFDRYYRGAADRITIPPISSEGLHRYDLLKKEMMSRGVMAPVLEGIRRTLAEGHRVFWVGDLFVPEGRQVPAEPPPAPAPWGWADAPYYELWGLQAGYLIKAHAKAGARQEIPVVQAVSPYEDASLYAFSGWWGGEGTN